MGRSQNENVNEPPFLQPPPVLLDALRAEQRGAVNHLMRGVSSRLLISDPPYIASRLEFDCTPKGKFLGLHLNGKRVSFTENVFYEFRREKIWQVWSVIDKAAIEAQL